MLKHPRISTPQVSALILSPAGKHPSFWPLNTSNTFRYGLLLVQRGHKAAALFLRFNSFPQKQLHRQMFKQEV
jgi:hypothetical protein